MKKKYEPRHQKSNEQQHPLDEPNVRDSSALLVPTSAIIITRNPRTDLGDLAELKESIAARGVLTPLLVAKTAAGIELLGGHRRLQCARDLGLAFVPCRIVETTEPEIIKLVDNFMRESLSPHDEFLALKRLLPMFAGNRSALARTLSKSPTYVTRAIKVADMIEAGLCAGAKLTKTALMELADAPDPQAALAAARDGKKESIRQARAAADNKTGRKSSGPIAGGRYADPIKLRETKTGWTLRVAWDPDRAPKGTREALIETLETLLTKLKR